MGLIDESDIYDRVLSAAEIQSLYTAGSAGKCKECTPPTADAGEDKTICPNASVQIGGDETGSGGTGALTFSWEPADGLSDATAANPTATPASTTTYTVTVTDANECAATDEVTVTVEDNQAPVITVAANPITLWPPNHKYATIPISQCVTSVQDNCTGSIPVSNVVITAVSSDEPDNTPGNDDGNTIADMVIAGDCKSVQLRQERQDSGNGRVYTIYLSVNDGNGNIGSATCLVTVPPNQSGPAAVDDGAVYTVNGSCGSGSLANAGNVNDLSGELSIQTALPEGYSLEQNYPNPFNPSTVIKFGMVQAGLVKLSVYNLQGQEVHVLIFGQMNPGHYEITWDGKDNAGKLVSSGAYLYKLRVNDFEQTRRMTFVK